MRDEGASYHYLPPSPEVAADEAEVKAIVDALRECSVPHHAAKTWTTSAPFRETSRIVTKRWDEGCHTVDIEATTLIAVAQFRGATFRQVLYRGDDLNGDEWDNRDWQDLSEIRERLFWLSAEACLRL